MIDIIMGLNSSIELLKNLHKLNEKIRNAEIDMIIADLNIQLAESKNSIAELLNRNSVHPRGKFSMKGRALTGSR
jgi:hypothetical protein